MIVSFLCTRVLCANEVDKCKLEHVFGYLWSTQDDELILHQYKPFIIEAYIDAAFALHLDSKAHMGVLISVGGVIVFFSITKAELNPT